MLARNVEFDLFSILLPYGRISCIMFKGSEMTSFSASFAHLPNPVIEYGVGEALALVVYFMINYAGCLSSCFKIFHDALMEIRYVR
jgi:hypothetical protein